MNDLTLLQKERSEKQLGLMLFHREINAEEAKIAAEDQGLRFFKIIEHSKAEENNEHLRAH